MFVHTLYQTLCFLHLAVFRFVANQSNFVLLGVRVTDIGRMMGQLWRLLPDDQKDVRFFVLIPQRYRQTDGR